MAEGHIVPPGYADVSVELRHSLLSRSAFLTFGVQITGGIASDAVAQAVYDSISLDTAPSLLSILDSEVTVLSATARIGQDGGAALVYQASGTAAGGLSGTSIPPNVAVLVHKRSARGGRRGRGRLYIPWGVVESKVDEAGKMTTADVAVIQLGVSSFLASLQSRNVPMCLLHTPSHDTKGPGSATGAPDLVTSVQVDPLVATQRRRLGRK